MPRCEEIVVGVCENLAQVQLRVDAFEGDAVDGDDGILHFTFGQLQLPNAISLLIVAARWRVDVAFVYREVSHVHLAFWAFLDGVAAFLQNAYGGVGVPFEEMDTHAVGSSGFAAAVWHRALVELQQFGAGHPPVSRRFVEWRGAVVQDGSTDLMLAEEVGGHVGCRQLRFTLGALDLASLSLTVGFALSSHLAFVGVR